MASRPSPILTIGGTDPSGGAGIQADLKTFAAHGCYGMSAITALVAQNAQGVRGVHACPPRFVAQQIRCVLDDVPARAIKTGMLIDKATVQTVIDTLTAVCPASLPPLIVDPVIVSTSGHPLLDLDAISLVKNVLLPLASIMTPDVPEAELILGLTPDSIKSIEDMMRAADKLSQSGARAVLVKSGRMKLSSADVLASGIVNVRWDAGCGPNQLAIFQSEGKKWMPEEEDIVVDVLYLPDSAEYVAFVRPRIETSTHGAGCTLSAALACGFAQGLSAFDAVLQATRYAHQAIIAASGIGKGHGPLDHNHSTIARVIPQPTLDNPYPFTNALISSCADLWKQYIEHPLVAQIVAGTLPKENFVRYLRQDYIYLIHHARAHGLLAAKSSDFASSGAAATIVLETVHESKLHVEYCAQWGITLEELASTPELPATAAYARYIMDVGLQGDDFMLIVAVGSCLLGYAELGRKVQFAGGVDEENPYKRWIDDCYDSEFEVIWRRGLGTCVLCEDNSVIDTVLPDLMEERAAADPPSATRFAQLQDVWERCIRFEIEFLDIGLGV